MIGIGIPISQSKMPRPMSYPPVCYAGGNVLLPAKFQPGVP
jgi:hypothetical protein